MHSFRLRYIVLGLLIYIQSAFCRTCGSDFHEDVTSRAILADVVVEGRARKAGPLDSRDRYNVTFNVGKLHKGDIRPAVGDKRRTILVGTFGAENPDECIIPVDIGSQNILFLKATPDPSFFRSAGYPEIADKKSKKLVRKGVCRKCGKFYKSYKIRYNHHVNGNTI